MSQLRIFIFFLIFSSGFAAFSHPDDELEVLEMELGKFDLPEDQITAEYEAALKRQRMRRLEAMPWQEKFILFIRAGIEHIIPKGLDHILFVLGIFFSSLIFLYRVILSGSFFWERAVRSVIFKMLPLGGIFGGSPY